jgi:hypothetical protein
MTIDFKQINSSFSNPLAKAVLQNAGNSKVKICKLRGFKTLVLKERRIYNLLPPRFVIDVSLLAENVPPFLCRLSEGHIASPGNVRAESEF